MKCKYCGCTAAENDIFCRECGKRIEKEAQMPESFAEITEEMPESLGGSESFDGLQTFGGADFESKDNAGTASNVAISDGAKSDTAIFDGNTNFGGVNGGNTNLSGGRFCSNCKKPLKEGAAFCNFCGASTKNGNTGALKMSGNILRAAEDAAKGQLSQGNLASTGCTAVYSDSAAYSDSKDSADFTQKKKNVWIPIIIVLAAVLIIGGGITAFLLLRGDSAKVKESGAATTHEILSDDDDLENGGKDDMVLTKEDKEDKDNSDEKTSVKIYFENVTASSYLPQDGELTYTATNLIDGDNNTAWTEGVAGYGEGQWIKFSSETPKKISRICILNGYCKNTETYYKNSRVKEVLVTFDQGESLTYDVDDIYNSWTELVLPKAVETKTVTIEIKSVYEGTNYKDTCVSEVKFK